MILCQDHSLIVCLLQRFRVLRAIYLLLLKLFFFPFPLLITPFLFCFLLSHFFFLFFCSSFWLLFYWIKRFWHIAVCKAVRSFQKTITIDFNAIDQAMWPLDFFFFCFIFVEIREAFRVLDRDGNGFISKQELGMAMRSLGYMPSEVELAIIMQRLDMDGETQANSISPEMSPNSSVRLSV